MKSDWTPRLRARRLAACAHDSNWDVEPRDGQARQGIRAGSTARFRGRRAHWAMRVRFWKEVGSPATVRLAGPPAMLTREAAAAAAGEPRRPI
jgi:hypothetical protein